jgi:hypothetical protein
MNDYEKLLTEDRRLVLLRGLNSAVGYSSSNLLLQRYCQAVGHTVSVDRLTQDLAWLAEQGLCTVQQAEGIYVATLNQRGLDVATGRATVPGVQRPQPGF